MAYTLKRNLAILMRGALYSTISLTGVSLMTLSAHAAPAVTGQKGCIMKQGGTAAHQLRPDEPDSMVYDICKDDGQNNWQGGDFTTADEVNAALGQVEQDARGYVDDKIQDVNGRIDKNRQSIDDLNTHNARQDQALGQHEQRVSDAESAIGAIKDGAVFYNHDENGNKSGGVTLNDGTGNPVALGNVAAGKAGTDAANVDQLAGALDGLGGGAHVNADGSITGPTYHVGGVIYHTVGGALEAQDVSAVRYVIDENGKPSNTVMLTGDGTGAPVTIANVAAGTHDTDAVNYGQVRNNVAYDKNADGTRSNSISLTGGAKGPVAIHNVANGVSDTDAANLSQVRKARQESFSYTDARVSSLEQSSNERFEALSGEISQSRQEARGGVASAMAAAGLRYDNRPGKLSLASGMGGFKGATSIAAGLGYTSEDGKWRLNSGLAHSFAGNDTAWNAGVSYTFN